MTNSGLWIILLEAGLALGLFVFIVWWTLPRKPAAQNRPGGESRSDTGEEPAERTPPDRR